MKEKKNSFRKDNFSFASFSFYSETFGATNFGLVLGDCVVNATSDIVINGRKLLLEDVTLGADTIDTFVLLHITEHPYL